MERKDTRYSEKTESQNTLMIEFELGSIEGNETSG